MVAGSLSERQEADLRRDLGNRDVQISNTGEQLIVTLQQDILFATDSTAIRADLQRDLKLFANNLQAYPKSTFTIISHTDNVGNSGHNRDLSNRQAFDLETVFWPRGRVWDGWMPMGVVYNSHWLQISRRRDGRKTAGWKWSSRLTLSDTDCG